MNRWGVPPDPDEKVEPEVPQAWREAPFTPSLSADDYLDALSSPASGPEAVRALRNPRLALRERRVALRDGRRTSSSCCPR